MTITLSGMNLHTNGDNEAGYDGVTDGPDTYNVAEQGGNSESWNVAKNATEVSTLAKAAVLDAVRGLYIMWMKSDLSYYYTDIKVKLQSSAGNDKEFTIATAANPAISGDFHAAALDYINKGVATGSYAPASHADSIVSVNNSSSGNIRSVINNWIDAIYFGAGHVISGTTVGDKCFTEAFDIDNLVANKYGVLSKEGSIIHSQGDMTFNGTALVSDGETLEFKETTNGFDRYNFNGTGSLTLKNSNVQADGAVDYDLDMSSMTAFSMTGGAIKQVNALTLIAGQTLDGVVLTDVASSSIGNNPDGCTWNLSGAATIETGGVVDGGTFNDGVDTASVIVENLTQIPDGIFNQATPNYAVRLTSFTDGVSQSWGCKTTGHDAGVTGSPVTPTSTGNEDLFIDQATGTITINVEAGATVPSIRSAGAVVNVVAGLITLTIKGLIAGSIVVIYDDDAVDVQELGTELQRNNTSTTQESFTYSGGKSGDDIVVVMYKSGYKLLQETITLGAVSAGYTLKPQEETN